MNTQKIQKFLSQKTPIFYSLLRKIRYSKNLFRSQKDVFSDYYKSNYWNNEDSFSGPGSDLSQTKDLIMDLPKIFKEYGIQSMLDAPCGDFFWMKNVDFNGIEYIGSDIVKDLIDENRKKYETEGISFECINLAQDKIPKVDLIFCRDLLVHLPNKEVKRIINNFIESGSKYLFTTDFNGRFKNIDIAIGDWRPIDLTLTPFNLPEPIFKYQENSTLGGGNYPDKFLSLWKLEDLSSYA